ncbi:MAG: CoA transferase [Deltaproteobacteria bacterium]|nr:CoA transferase [Deltaproteobacteria bacterium]
MTLALAGIKVIDVSQGVPGSLCSMTLGDLGATVTKIEPPGGDWLREVGPFTHGESALFMRLNRNKKGVCVNLKEKAGQELVRRLAKSADVFIEGYTAGVMERLGLSYDTLCRENRGLIYCSISGYGSRGPLADTPATELDLQAFVGKFRHLGRPEEPPLRVGFDIIASNAAWAACQGIMAALYSRELTGAGQRVETSLLDAAVAIMQWTIAAETTPDAWRARPISGYTESPDHGFECKDAHFLMDWGNQNDSWQTLCKMLDAEHIATDPRFNEWFKRLNNRAELAEELKPFLAKWSFDDLQQVVQGMGGTIVRMNSAATLLTGPQVAALGIVKELDHPIAGKYQTIDVPWLCSEPIAELSPVPAPSLGEHNEEVLKSLGYTVEQIGQLGRAGVVGQ